MEHINALKNLVAHIDFNNDVAAAEALGAYIAAAAHNKPVCDIAIAAGIPCTKACELAYPNDPVAQAGCKEKCGVRD
jgi:hypothetical protein